MTEIDALLQENAYSMFMPNDRNDLLTDYPELQKVPSLRAIKPKEVLFVWYYACKASPGVRKLHTEKERIEFAVRAAWETPTKEMLEKYGNKKWGQAIDQAISDMRRYELQPRIINKLLCERIQRNIQDVIDTDMSMAVAWGDKKDALAAMDKAMDMLPRCIKLAEGDFGIVEGSISEEEVGSVMGRMHLTQMEDV